MSAVNAPSISSMPYPFSTLRKDLVKASTGKYAINSNSFMGLGRLQIMKNKYRFPNTLPKPLAWLNGAKEPTTLKFAALFDMNSIDTKITPYLNMPANTEITDNEFRKLKATFAVLPLPDDPKLYPQEAINCARETVRFFASLLSKTEETQNEYLLVGKKNLHKWNNTDSNGKTTLKLQTEALFVQEGEKSMFGDEPGIGVSDFPDPVLRYEQFFEEKPEMANYQVITPNIIAYDGTIIPPSEYHTKLRGAHGIPICVEVILLMWEIQPTKIEKKPSSRTYQLIIKSIQLLKPLPAPTPSESSPRKRRWSRSFEDEKASPTKKRKN